MAINLVDTVVFGLIFDDESKAIFDENGVLESWLMFEKTLAKVQGELGIIPKDLAEEIYNKADLKNVSLKKISRYFLETGLASIALIKVLQDSCSRDAGEYIHYGATSQDLYDTGLAIRLKKFMSLLFKNLKDIRDLLLTLATKYKKTLMIGRTHGRHAIPITFGFKMAILAEVFDTHLKRAQEIYPRIIVGNLSGAVGTFASFKAISKANALEIEKRVLKELGLESPLISIQSTIERFCEFLNFLSLVSMTCEKLAQDFFTLQRQEISEIKEPPLGNKDVSSSTMPHKQNPKGLELILGISKLIRSCSHALMETSMKDERDRSPFWVEDIAIPQACIFTMTVLSTLKKILKGLEVFSKTMEKNVHMTKGLIMSENVMIEIAKKTGKKQSAHEWVSNATARAIKKKLPFEEILLDDQQIRKHFSPQEIKEILNPLRYLGMVDELVDRVCNSCKKD
jgi:adenylosuccinate lyase